MDRCASCGTRRATRQCLFLQVPICAICCLERQQEHDPTGCPPACAHSARRRRQAGERARHTAANHGPWLAPRIQAFSAWEEIYTAALDLEEAIWRFSRSGAPLTDREVLAALDYLAGRLPGPPGELGCWLEEALRADEEEGGEGEAYPPLLMLGLLPAPVRRDTLLRLRAIVARDAARGLYLARSTAYFEQLERADRGWAPPPGAGMPGPPGTGGKGLGRAHS
jgi:hypothetical protein